MIKVSVTGLAQAQEALRKEIAKIVTDKSVLIGIHEDAGRVDDGNMTMATLGAIQHFGNSRIPARPWLDVGVKSGIQDYVTILKEHSDDIDNALELVGLVAVGKTQEYMTNLQSPANARSTIKKKGSANPLIDNGDLKRSITYSITSVPLEEGVG